nr:nucleic acid-binding, OB-fold protein [Tanacetum cinerariifolium]
MRSWCLLIPSAEKKKVVNLDVRWIVLLQSGVSPAEETSVLAVVRREFTPPFEEGVRAQNIGVSRNVRRCLLPCFSVTAGSANRFPLAVESWIQTVASVDVRNTSDRNCVPISRVFDRFRNVRGISDQAEYMTQTTSCSRPLAAVDIGNHGSVYTAVVPVSNVPKDASVGLISNNTMKNLEHTGDVLIHLFFFVVTFVINIPYNVVCHESLTTFNHAYLEGILHTWPLNYQRTPKEEYTKPQIYIVFKGTVITIVVIAVVYFGTTSDSKALNTLGKLNTIYVVKEDKFGDHEGIAVGSNIVLLRTFTGGPRVIYNRFSKKRFATLHTLLWVDSNNEMQDRRQVRTKKSIGRLTYVRPSSGDLFYFRMLLCHQKGCKSPIEVRTINEQILPTYWAACEALGLLGDDKEWDIALEESTVSATRTRRENEQDSSWVTIPPKYIVTADAAGMSELIDFIYDNTMLKEPTVGSLQEKVIVCPKTMTANVLNAKILSNNEGQSKTYLSNDGAISLATETSETELLYLTGYLNTMTFPRLPPHELELKVGSPIMLLRNANLSGGLCNGTRMIVRSMMSKLIEAQIITGMRIGKKATMDINNVDYFSPLLKPHAAYRISNFMCERTKSYQQTLENQITLRFGKITVFEPLPGKESEFPNHHFELISYHQFPSRVPYRDENSKLIYPIITDYLGCVRSISNITPFGTPTTSQKYLRKVDIEDLDGNIVEFIMWDELSRQFDKINQKANTPIIIAISSCRVKKYKDTQLSATPATHYYINPQTPKAQHVYTAKIQLQPATSNSQVPLSRPRGVYFTCEGMITSVQENRDWKYPSCSKCSKSSTQQNGTYICEDHGRQDRVTYKHKFKATVTDGTAISQFTFFIKAGEKLPVIPARRSHRSTAVATNSTTPSKETIGKEKHIT